MSKRDRVFVSYSHKDKGWLEKFSAILAPDIRNERVDYWDDRELEPGDSWYAKILDSIDRARVAVLLVSPNFLASRFIMDVELPRILAARQDGLTITWIPLFGTFYGPEALPDTKAITDLQAAFESGIPLAEQDEASQTQRLLDVCRHIQRLFDSGRVPCNLPFPPLADSFKGRDRALASLDSNIRQHGSAAIVQPQAIQGLGGIGKTRLAIEYAWRHQDAFTAFLFVSANTPDDLERNLGALCRPDCLDLLEHKSGKQDEQCSAVVRWLQEKRGWLLILDNVDTIEGVHACKALVAKLRGGHVIITSRLTEWGRGVHPMALDVLPLDDAVALLLDSVLAWRSFRTEDETEARALADRLGCLPLALAHAAAYVHHHRQTFAKYLAEFELHFDRLLAYHDDSAIEYDPGSARGAEESTVKLARSVRTKVVKTVATTFFLTFDRLSPEAKAILQATAFFAPAPIPVAVLEEASEQILALVRLWTEETGEAAIGQSAADALAELARYSLISLAEDSFGVHRMLWEILRHRRVAAERDDLWAREVARLMAANAPSINPYEPATWGGWLALQPHAEHAWERIRQLPGSDQSFRIPQGLGLLCFGRGLYSRGEVYAREGLDLLEASRTESAETLLSVSNLADLLYKQEKYDEAEPLFERAVDGSNRVLGAQHPDTLMRRNNWALCVEMKSGFSASKPLYDRALKDATAALGQNHAVTLDIADNFAGSMLVHGDYEDAEPMFRQILAGKQHTLGVGHWQTCVTMNNLGVTLSQLGRKAEAEVFYRSALEGLEKTVGSEHPDYIRGLANLAGLLVEKGDTISAISMLRRALEARDRVLGSEHRLTVQTFRQLAHLLHGNGDFKGLQDLLRERLARSDRTVGPEHQSTVSLCREMSQILYRAGDDVSTESLDRRVAHDCEHRFGLEDGRTAQAWHDYACTLRNLGKVEEAETLLGRALAVAVNGANALPSGSPILIHWKLDLAATLLMQPEKWHKVVEIARECWERFENKYDLNAARLLFVLVILSCMSNGRYQYHLGQLKALLVAGPIPVPPGVPVIWRLPSLLRHVESRLPQFSEMLSRLFDALNSPMALVELEQVPEWRGQQVVPLTGPGPIDAAQSIRVL